jgi:hypothetical protein
LARSIAVTTSWRSTVRRPTSRPSTNLYSSCSAFCARERLQLLSDPAELGEHANVRLRQIVPPRHSSGFRIPRARRAIRTSHADIPYVQPRGASGRHDSWGAGDCRAVSTVAI